MTDLFGMDEKWCCYVKSLSPPRYLFISVFYFDTRSRVFCHVLRPGPNQDARVLGCSLDEVSGRCDNA